MFLWFLGTAVLSVWFVFRDPRFDYRLLLVGAVLPDVIDVWFGGARVLHSVTASVALLAVVMIGTSGRRSLRRLLLPLPIGTFLHLVFDVAWNDSTVFWWPFLGTSFDGARLPVADRGAWGIALEAVGAVMVAWIWRTCGLSHAAARARFARTGQLVPLNL